jgi:hypothetical protein
MTMASLCDSVPVEERSMPGFRASVRGVVLWLEGRGRA